MPFHLEHRYLGLRVLLGAHIFSTADYALAFARQALYGLNGVYIKSAEETQNGFDFTVIINHSERQVFISR